MDVKVIDLSELRSADEFPAYAAIYSSITTRSITTGSTTTGSATTAGFVLSPDSMRWNDNILLSRLEHCRLFWLNQKKKLRCKLSELFDPLLRHHYGADYIAVFSSHPWQCLLYLHYQMRHQGRGLFLLQSRLDQNIFKSLDWDCWFTAQQDLFTHLAVINAKGFRVDTLHSRQAQFKRFVQRIGVTTPYEMSQADANSITRRFGKWLGLVWQWSFTETSSLEWFPWIKLQTETAPAVKRDLEYPVNQWAYIEVLLREDFTRLSESFHAHDCEHINRMLWEVTLFNYQKVSVELSFRHPYSLQRDMPGFETALYQARYIFDDMMRQLRQRDSDLDLPECMPFVAWRIEVCERIQLAPEIWDLFTNEIEQVDYQQITSLQNKLPIAFECYQTEASFFPEQSFHSCSIGASTDNAFDCYQWSVSATNKPLFYYQAAQPIEPPGPMAKFFLERNSNQWWLGQDALQSIRDYYLLQDHRGRRSWVYRDGDGGWFKQGEYC